MVFVVSIFVTCILHICYIRPYVSDLDGFVFRTDLNVTRIVATFFRLLNKQTSRDVYYVCVVRHAVFICVTWAACNPFISI